jgi:5-methylcytosine-specific restriction endonuclease McrA
MKKSKTLKQWLTPKLRRLSLQWPERHKALNKVKHSVHIGKFKNGNPKNKIMFGCEHCGILSDKSEVQVDHKIEVSIAKTIGEYISRLFCAASELQVLCKPCHLMKTNYPEIFEEQKKTKKKD